METLGETRVVGDALRVLDRMQRALALELAACFAAAVGLFAASGRLAGADTDAQFLCVICLAAFGASTSASWRRRGRGCVHTGFEGLHARRRARRESGAGGGIPDEMAFDRQGMICGRSGSLVAVSLFEYVTVASSIILSFAVVRLLDTIPHAFHASRRDAVHGALVVCAIWGCAQFWWVSWSQGATVQWTYPKFLLYLTAPALLYSLARTLSSPDPDQRWNPFVTTSTPCTGVSSRCSPRI